MKMQVTVHPSLKCGALEPNRQQNERNNISKAKIWWSMISGDRKSATL